MTQYSFNVNKKSVVGQPGWNANGTLQTLDITDQYNSANQQNCSYSYDDLARVSGVSCTGGTPWGQTFTYDAYGNISKSVPSGSTGISWLPGYNAATNQYTLSGTSYDSDGNLTNDTFHTYQWDANGRPTQISQSSGQSNQTYDAQGNMVEQSFTNPPWIGQYLYDEHGYEYGFSHPTSVGWIYIPLPGGGNAVYTNGTPANYYVHADWLGSGRLSSTQTQPTTVSSDMAFAPFGERYATTGNAYDAVFGGMKELMTADMFDASFREYHPTQGRWISPDPSGLGAVDITNPQTWNRYAYVANNPLSFIDPLGLNMQHDGGCDSTQSDCGSSGGSPSDPGAGGATDFSASGNSSSFCPICIGSYGWFGTAGIDEGYFDYLFADHGSAWVVGFGSPMGNNFVSAITGGGTPDSPYFMYVLVRSPFGPQGNLSSGAANNSEPPISRYIKSLIFRPWSFGILLPIVIPAGPAGTLSFDLDKGFVCLGVGGGVGARGVNGGPLWGDTQNSAAVLSGASVSVNVAGPVGAQIIQNPSGKLYGPTVGAPGASVAVTYSWCSGK